VDSYVHQSLEESSVGPFSVPGTFAIDGYCVDVLVAAESL